MKYKYNINYNLQSMGNASCYCFPALTAAS